MYLEKMVENIIISFFIQIQTQIRVKKFSFCQNPQISFCIVMVNWDWEIQKIENKFAY